MLQLDDFPQTTELLTEVLYTVNHTGAKIKKGRQNEWEAAQLVTAGNEVRIKRKGYFLK